MKEYSFMRVVDFKTLDTFKNVSKCSGYSFPIGHTEAVLIRRKTPLLKPQQCAMTSDELKALRQARRNASRIFDSYIYIQMPHDEFEVFKCESEDKEETIANAFKDWCVSQGYKF